MSDIVNEFFHRHYPADLDDSKFQFTSMLGGMRRHRDYTVDRVFPRMECADGFSMSAQGHSGAYSSPRDDFAKSYSAVEVGFPSEREELLMEYAEEPERPTETVYGYVPVSVVIAVIEKHGGLKPAAEAVAA